MTMNQEGYPVFKGLQKPLEFMGIRGRFLTLAAAAIGVSFVGFIGFSIALGKLAGFIAMLVMAFSIALGKLAGFIAMLVMAVVGLVTIYVKQRGGLHNKRRAKGIYVYKNACRVHRHAGDGSGRIGYHLRQAAWRSPQQTAGKGYLCLQESETQLVKLFQRLWHVPRKEYLTDSMRSWRKRTAMSSFFQPRGNRRLFSR